MSINLDTTNTEKNGPGYLPKADGRTPAPHESGKKPEPPVRRNPQLAPTPPNRGNRPHPEFESVRRIIAAAQIMALISLVIGGIVLSTAAFVTAIIGYRKTIAGAISARAEESALWHAMRRSAIAAIIMAILVLALNIVELVYIYPIVLDMVQSGDYSSFWSDGGSTGSQNGSFWG